MEQSRLRYEEIEELKAKLKDLTIEGHVYADWIRNMEKKVDKAKTKLRSIGINKGKNKT